MKVGSLVMALMLPSALAACAAGPPFDDPFEPYAQRINSITLSAGNAKEANAAIQVIDPWPSYVYDTHIPGSGARLADAVNRYEDVSKLSKAPKPITPIYSDTVGIAAVSNGP